MERCGKINAVNSGSESWTGIGVVAGCAVVMLITQGPHVQDIATYWRIKLLHILQEVGSICKTRNHLLRKKPGKKTVIFFRKGGRHEGLARKTLPGTEDRGADVPRMALPTTPQRRGRSGTAAPALERRTPRARAAHPARQRVPVPWRRGAAAGTAARVSGGTARRGARHHQAGAGVASPGRSHHEAHHAG